MSRVAYFAAAAAATLALSAIVKPIASTVGGPQGEAPAVHGKAPKNEGSVEVVVTRQPAESYSENSLNASALREIESWTAESITAKLRRHGNPAHITTEGVLMERAGRTLAIVRVRENGGPANMAIIHGFDRGDFVRLLCADRGGSQIEVTRGPCGEKLREVFGE